MMASFQCHGEWFAPSGLGMMKNTGIHSVRKGRFLGFDLLRFLDLQDSAHVTTAINT